jgi:hypothetical protein
MTFFCLSSKLLIILLTHREVFYSVAVRIRRLVRVMRILRVYKLVRHFAGLQSLIYTLQQAYREMGLLLLLGMFIGMKRYRENPAETSIVGR